MRIFRAFYSRPHESCRIQVGGKLFRASHFGIGIKPRRTPADFLHPGDFWLGEEGLLLPGSRPSGGYEVVCLPYDPELGPLDPLGP